MSSPTIKTENPAREHLLPQDDSSGMDAAKPRLQTDEQHVPAEAAQEPPPQHFRLRALVAISIPAIVTAYYAVIWVHLVQNTPIDETVKYSTYSASLIFYSWFIIGVFALSWSKFGLVGVEAAMLLRSRFWAAPDMVAMVMHSNGTWSGPSGWYAAVRGRRFYRLWSLLALLSFLPFVAVPLSGLVFEISDGFVKTSGAANVKGRNSTTFNERYDSQTVVSKPAEQAWKVGTTPTIPGFGVIYTNGSVDRSEHPEFERLPNAMPLSSSIADLFLAPQAENPVAGTAWGMRVKYDCSIVKSVSEFTVLSQKPESSILDPAYGKYLKRHGINVLTPSGDNIYLWNTTIGEDGINEYYKYNVQAYFEVGMSGPVNGSRKYQKDYPDYEAEEGDKSLVLEYAAWQYRTTKEFYEDEKLAFNDTVAPFIQDMGTPFIDSGNKTFHVNTTFFTMKGDLVQGVPNDEPSTNSSALVASYAFNNSESRIIAVARPIGVRCVASSGLGTAELDGVTSTFSNFKRSDPDVDPMYEYGPERFGYATQKSLERSEFYQHYVSGGLPGVQPNGNTNRYPQFVDGLSLLRSANLAYALDAFDLIYGVTSGFAREWAEPGLTSSREGKILTVASLIPGAGVGYFVLVLFCVWAGGSAGLAVWYGFRRRPAERVGGEVMLRKGADMAEEIKGDAAFMGGKPFYESKMLAALQGS